MLSPPNSPFEERFANASPRHALWAVLGSGALWAGFCALLFGLGHSSPAPHPLFAPERHYLWQALYVVPTVWLMWRIFARVAHRFSGAPAGEEALQRTRAAIGLAFGLPLGAVFVVPDIVTFLVRGFDDMLPAMAVYVPLCLLVTLAAATAALRGAHAAHGTAVGEARVSRSRAFVGALSGLLAAWAFGSSLLR